jgi:hypothetical protein
MRAATPVCGVEEKDVRREHGEEVEVRMFIDTRALPLMVMSADAEW